MLAQTERVTWKDGGRPLFKSQQVTETAREKPGLTKNH